MLIYNSLRGIQNGGEGGIRTPGTGFIRYGGLANHCLQPLGHLSVLHWFSLKWKASYANRPRLFKRKIGLFLSQPLVVPLVVELREDAVRHTEAVRDRLVLHAQGVVARINRRWRAGLVDEANHMRTGQVMRAAKCAPSKYLF